MNFFWCTHFYKTLPLQMCRKLTTFRSCQTTSKELEYPWRQTYKHFGGQKESQKVALRAHNNLVCLDPVFTHLTVTALPIQACQLIGVCI